MADIPTFVPAFGVFTGAILQNISGSTPANFQTAANTGAVVLPLIGKDLNLPRFSSPLIISSNPFFQTGGTTGGGDLPPIARGQGFPLGDGNF